MAFNFSPHNIFHCLGSFYEPSSFFLEQHMLSHFSLLRFFVSNICSDSFKNQIFWNGKIVFFRRLYSWLLFCLHRNSSYVSLYVFPSYVFLFLKHHSILQLSLLLNMCSRGNLRDSLNYWIFFRIIFYRVPQIFLESESISFGESTSLIPTFVDDGKIMRSNNLHMMGGIYKEGWIWDSLIKFSFGWLQKLASGTFVWMI